jgi:hypothetical protein
VEHAVYGLLVGIASIDYIFLRKGGASKWVEMAKRSSLD